MRFVFDDRVAACTIVSKRHLSMGRVVATSFRQHHPNTPFFLLLADEIEGYFNPADEPYTILRLSDLGICGLQQLRFHYNRQELGYAVTPYLLMHLLDVGFERAVFIKEESLVLASMNPVLDRLENSSVLLTPHVLVPLQERHHMERELKILLAGVYNCGFTAFANTSESRRFLAWWQDRVFSGCRYAVSEGMHFEQRWLDFAPAFIQDLCLVRDPGMNVAHWNLPERTIRVEGEAVFVDGEVCRLFRFSGFDPDLPEAVTRYSARLTMVDIGPAADVFRRYGRLLDQAGYADTKTWPYAHDCFDNGVPIPSVARQAFREFEGAMERFGDPFQTAPAGSYYRWLNSQTEPARSPVTNLWKLIYEQRPDLKAAFPDFLGRDTNAFLGWTSHFGMLEHDVPEAFRLISA